MLYVKLIRASESSQMSVRIPTNLRTLLILEVIGRSDRALTATQINAEIGLPKQTVHRLVSTLEEQGFLIRDASGKHYRPSRRLRLLGSGLLHASRFHITRHQIMKSVANDIGEAVNYAVPEETGMHYLDRIETNWPFRIQLPIGTDVPFHCTASGKCFMSTLSKKARENFVSGLDLAQLTPSTHTTKDALLADIKACAKRGYALDNEEFMKDMLAIAVPVLDDKNRFVASLAVHGPKQRLQIDTIEQHQHVLVKAAKTLQSALFIKDEE